MIFIDINGKTYSEEELNMLTLDEVVQLGIREHFEPL